MLDVGELPATKFTIFPTGFYARMEQAYALQQPLAPEALPLEVRTLHAVVGIEAEATQRQQTADCLQAAALLESDFWLLPVMHGSRASLVVVCHPGLAAPTESQGPCILYLDPMAQHPVMLPHQAPAWLLQWVWRYARRICAPPPPFLTPRVPPMMGPSDAAACMVTSALYFIGCFRPAGTMLPSMPP